MLNDAKGWKETVAQSRPRFIKKALGILGISKSLPRIKAILAECIDDDDNMNPDWFFENRDEVVAVSKKLAARNRSQSRP